MPDADWYNARNDRAEARACQAFVHTLGMNAADERDREIEALPKVEFKGRYLVTLKCSKCGSDRNIPRSVCWSLISLSGYICAWCGVRG